MAKKRQVMSSRKQISALQVFEPEADAAYSIEVVSRITHIPRRRIAVYCRHHLVSPVVEPDRSGWFFDEEGIRTLRQIEQLRTMHGASLPAIELIFDLMRQVENLQDQLRFVRL